MLSETIVHGISRNVKRISVFASISAIGKSLVPYTITLEDSASVQEQLKKRDVGFRTDLVLNSNLVRFGWIRTVLFPDLAELQRLDE
jgi:hypothetical protein